MQRRSTFEAGGGGRTVRRTAHGAGGYAMQVGPESRELRELLDQHAIERLLKRYASAIDRKDYDRLDDVFAPDAWIDYVEAGGIAGDYPAIKRWLAGVLEPIEEMQHFITNVELEFDGDAARGSTYTLNVNGIRVDGEMQHMIVGAVYVDRFARTPRGWRIVERRESRLCTFGHVFGPPQ
jgi:ketosteroid isomerase-like protein